ncbi:PAP2 superfamily-domain-containing protein [Flammula alnicola]|nr:PAP2 superfamily-domain-containing protein [Flammula alnicola]
MDSPKSVHFTLSMPPSEASSRASSPAPAGALRSKVNHDQNGTTYNYNDIKSKFTLDDDLTPGRQGRDVYDTTLSWWRAALRRKLVATVHWESQAIAKMQDKIRTPWLDAYFVYSSTLGTHTFFMTILPALFFFGYGEMGRGLLILLGLGIYASSVVKDLFCSPRPFAPPVTRLTIGSHHLEYGFPSTHSTNSVSIALFFFGYVHRLASIPITVVNTLPSSLMNGTFAALLNSTEVIVETVLTPEIREPIISQGLYILLSTILFIYAFSVVFGRLYTAMHSFTDCLMGIFLGAGIWWWHTSWAGIPVFFHASNPLHMVFTFFGFGIPHSSGSLLVYLGKGLRTGEWIEDWIQRGGWEVPLILIPLCLLAVHIHPQPVDDCPCFEDAIAILSVVLGALVSRWALSYSQFGLPMAKIAVMPGSGWILELDQWVQVERGWSDVMLWWTMAAIKMGVGILVIFTWRIIAKSALHLILPPTFRLLARAFRLPHRRFYTPATEYKSVPSEFHSSGAGGGFGLHPIPSVIDLPGTAGVSVEVGGIGSGVQGVSNISPFGHASGRSVKMRSGSGQNGNGSGSLMNGNGRRARTESTGKDGQPGGVKHYDADVLTKVIVYAGIAVLAAEALPLAFDVLGWGVKSWVST